MYRSACAIVLTLATLVVCPARSAAAADDTWGEVSLPGGVAAARAAFGLGTPDGRLDAGFLVDFIRRYGSVGDWSAAIERLARYLDAIEAVRVATIGSDEVGVPARTAPEADRDRFRRLAGALGLNVRRGPAGFQVSPGTSSDARQRARWMTTAGFDVDGISTAWNSGETAAIHVAEARLPLPLAALWQPGAAVDRPGRLIRLLSNRSSALFYAGLMALDDETRAFLGAHPAAVERIRERSAASFAAFAGNLRVTDGVVSVPGGRAAWRQWQAIVGHPPSAAVAFIDALLSIDGGRLAQFYGAVATAPASTQAAMLLDTGLGGVRAFDAIYDLFKQAADDWPVAARPFDRPTTDPAWALMLLDLDSGGLADRPWLAAVLARAVDGHEWPASGAAEIETASGASAAPDRTQLLRWVLAGRGEALARVRLLRHAQRLSLDGASQADVEIALRTRRDLPTLALALERMRVTDPAVIARAGRAAYGLSRAGGRDAFLPVVSRWQAALALLEQADRLRPLPSADVARLVTALADAAEHPGPRVTDAIARWITTALIPALVPARPQSNLDVGTLQAVMTARAAGQSTRVTWEGLAYERSPLRLAARDVAAIVAAGRLTSHVDVRSLVEIADRFTRGVRDEAAALSLATDLDLLRRSLQTDEGMSPALVRLRDDLDAASAELRAAHAPAGFARVLEWPAIAAVRGDAVDAVVQPVVYALAMSPLHQPAALVGEAWSFHGAGQDAAAADWWRAAWQRASPDTRAGGGSALAGSWLTLDLSLADAAIPRRFDQGGDMARSLRAAMLGDLAIRLRTNDRAMAAADAALADLARGRTVLADWTRTPPPEAVTREGLGRMALGPTRTSLVQWTLAHAPESLAGLVTATETVRLGGDGGAPRLPIVSADPIDGCVCLMPAPAAPLEDLRSYWRLGVTASFANDLTLRLAEALHVLNLPLVLTEDLMPLAVADWLASVEPFANDDWEALTRLPRQLTQADVEGYLLQLVADGVLAPAPEGEEVVP
jgi:hypothetical protein